MSHRGQDGSESEPEVLTVEEAAEFLRIGRTQLYDAIGRQEVPHQRIGRSIRLSRTVLVRWLGGSWQVAQQTKESSCL